ncbi:hypothetical protein RAA17_14655 [Komagataeibacter rhaeticus]|nr:hypothetical protein [Komagataeibacter rhaeticus]
MQDSGCFRYRTALARLRGILVWGLGGFMSVPGHAQTIPVAARDVWQADEIPASESQDTPSAAGGSLLGDMGTAPVAGALRHDAGHSGCQ